MADPVAHDLRQATRQDVQVVLAGADAFVERVRRRVVLDQRAAEEGERAIGCDRILADRAAACVAGVGVASCGREPACRSLAAWHRWAIRV